MEMIFSNRGSQISILNTGHYFVWLYLCLFTLLCKQIIDYLTNTIIVGLSDVSKPFLELWQIWWPHDQFRSNGFPLPPGTTQEIDWASEKIGGVLLGR